MMRTTSGNDWIWVATRWAIYARDGFACVVCGIAFSEDAPRREMLSLDHVRPRGGNDPSNLVTLCVSCNSSRQARAYSDWKHDAEGLVLAATRKPICRATGRRLAAQVRPERIRRHRKRAMVARQPETIAARAAACAGVPF